MKKWLKNMKAPKFYRYWYYRQYAFSKSVWDDDAQFSSVIGSAMTMGFHFVFLFITIGRLIFNKNSGTYLFLDRNIFELLFFAGLFIILSYFMFYYSDKWKLIVAEFEAENSKQRKLGNFYLFIYLFVTLFCLLPLAFWLFAVPVK